MNPQQKAAFRRKIYYIATVLVLFTVSMFWRGIIPVPLSTARAGESRSGSQSLPDRLNNASILNQARTLDLRELEQGEPEISSEFFRLAASGYRGFVVTYLWYDLMDKQKRNDFHKMEQTVRFVTWLQPHFITPWLFQSWNISYNVSVEMQGSGDMYHYIARGIDLLAEGERKNTHTYQNRKIGSPDMRYMIGFYYQNKFGVSDQVEVLRCLFQLSCIPPDERNWKDFIDKSTGAVDMQKFKDFCEKYPHLVRRLRGEDLEAANKSDDLTKKKVLEALKCPHPEDIVQFLKENQEILGRYTHAKELASPEKQFPALPPKFDEKEARADSETKDDFSAFKAARAWYKYSLVVVPPNPLDSYDEPLPTTSPIQALHPGAVRPGEYDPFIYRLPRQPMLIIFRQGGPRVQTAQAEMEQKEGWFDNEGWRIDDPKESPKKWWFPDPDTGGKRPLNFVVGNSAAWSLEEWRLARDMWHKHGQENALEVSPQRMRRYEEKAQGAGGFPSDPTDAELSDPALRLKFEARTALFFYHQNRSVTNFPYFLGASEAESKPETVKARKTLWQAEQARKMGLRDAVHLFEDGLKQWKAVLAANKNFHRPERSTHTEEETYNYELAYLRLLVQDDEKVRARANEIAHRISAVLRLTTPVLHYEPFPFAASMPYWASGSTTFLGYAASLVWAAPSIAPEWRKDALEDIKWYVAETEFSPFSGVIKAEDGVSDPERLGTPWVQNEVKNIVRNSQGVQKKPQQTPQQPGSAPPSPTPPGTRQ